MRKPLLRFTDLLILMLLFSATTLIAAETSAKSAANSKDIKTLHILWVGNSYTAGGPLPQVVQKMMNEGRTNTRMEYKTSIMGGMGYKYHVEDGKAIRRIVDGWKDDKDKRHDWDMVVLQNKSWGPVSLQDEMRKYGMVLSEVSKAFGAKPVFYCTWAKKYAPEQAQTIFDMYTEVAEANDGLLAPAGQAWKYVYENPATKSIKLYRFDRSHPSSWGVYLNACVFYATLTGESPVGLKLRSVEPWKTTERYTKNHLKARKNLVLSEDDLYNGPRTLTDKEALILQKAAWKAVQERMKIQKKIDAAKEKKAKK
ncbi:hypothetical protein JD969_20800 [Planctomycetota bacterium]|nr:hypothetical protein JD969_20800 [Planctomycetota bacterium]